MNLQEQTNRIKQMMGLVNEQGDPLTKTTTTQVSKKIRFHKHFPSFPHIFL
jgi:hypothetical protein